MKYIRYLLCFSLVEHPLPAPGWSQCGRQNDQCTHRSCRQHQRHYRLAGVWWLDCIVWLVRTLQREPLGSGHSVPLCTWDILRGRNHIQPDLLTCPRRKTQGGRLPKLQVCDWRFAEIFDCELYPGILHLHPPDRWMPSDQTSLDWPLDSEKWGLQGRSCTFTELKLFQPDLFSVFLEPPTNHTPSLIYIFGW